MLLDALTGAGDPRVTTAIRTASRTTGVTFDYLLKTAMRESALNPAAKASTSSARGLYQFIESTWLQTMKEEGPRFGLDRYAGAIERSTDGRYFVRDPGRRSEILKLRENPEVAALMAGAFAGRNARELSRAFGREPTSGELYMAHFLGAAGAKRLYALKSKLPNAPAATVFPEAAAANRTIFYESGRARSAGEVYALLTGRHDRTPTVPLPAEPKTAVAALQEAVQSKPAGPAQKTDAPPANLAFATRTDEAPRPASAAASARPMHALFRTDGVAPVSPAVAKLWSPSTTEEAKLAVVDTTNVLPRDAQSRPLVLSDPVAPGVKRG